MRKKTGKMQKYEQSGRVAYMASHQGEVEPASDPGLTARPEPQAGGIPQADARGKDASAQILRLVPKHSYNPFEAWLSAMRDYQLHWLRLWSSWMPR